MLIFVIVSFYIFGGDGNTMLLLGMGVEGRITEVLTTTGALKVPLYVGFIRLCPIFPFLGFLIHEKMITKILN